MMGLIDVVIAYTFIKDLTTPFDRTQAFKYGIIDAKGKILRKRNTLPPDQRAAYPSILTTLAWNIKRLLSKVLIGKSSLASFATALYLLKEEMEKQGMKDKSPEADLLGLVEKSMYGSDRTRMINEAFQSSLLPARIETGRYDVFDESVIVEKELKSFTNSMGIPLFEARSENGRRMVFSLQDIQDQVGPVAPANAVGSGMVKGIAPGEDPPIRVKKKRIYELAGRYTIFDVTPEEFERCTCAKKKFEKWGKYFDEDSETGSEIRRYSFNNPEKGIMLRNSETGQTMMFRRRWSDQRLAHNKKVRLLMQQEEGKKVYTIWTR